MKNQQNLINNVDRKFLKYTKALFVGLISINDTNTDPDEWQYQRFHGHTCFHHVSHDRMTEEGTDEQYSCDVLLTSMHRCRLGSRPTERESQRGGYIFITVATYSNRIGNENPRHEMS